MLIRLPPKVIGPSAEERAFLTSLDKRLHYKIEVESTVYGKELMDKFYDAAKLEELELTNVLSLVGNERRLALMPSNTAFGFKIGYFLGHVGPVPDLQGAKADWEGLLGFVEEQLPKGYDFKRLSHVFMRADNISLLNSCGIKTPSRDRYKYEY